MFDNPKKELERIQAQLLAAEAHDSAEDFEDELFNESNPDDILDDELYAALYGDQDFSHRCAAFGVPDENYVMDSDRYVAVAKKKKKWFGDLLFAILLVVLAAAILIGRWQGWLG